MSVETQLKLNYYSFMKMLFLISTLMFKASVSIGQLSFTEMRLLLTKDISQSEDFLISKQYKFYNREYRNNCNSYDFAKGKNSTNDNATAFVTIQVCTNEKTVYQEISNENLIPKIKQDAQSQGLSYLKTESYENTIVHYYRSKSYDLMIMSKKSSEGFTTYEIALEKL